MKKALGFAAAAGLLAISCSKDVIYGSGKISEDVRQVGSFSGVRISGEAKVFIIRDSIASLRLSGYQNILDRIESISGTDGVLRIGNKQGVEIRNSNLEIYITTPTLGSLACSGKTNTEVRGGFAASRLSIDLSGLSELSWKDSSSADTLALTSSGSVKCYLFPLDAGYIHVDNSGNTLTEVTASERISGALTGNCILYYRGNPMIDVSLSGASKIEKK